MTSYLLAGVHFQIGCILCSLQRSIFMYRKLILCEASNIRLFFQWLLTHSFTFLFQGLFLSGLLNSSNSDGRLYLYRSLVTHTTQLLELVYFMLSCLLRISFSLLPSNWIRLLNSDGLNRVTVN